MNASNISYLISLFVTMDWLSFQFCVIIWVLSVSKSQLQSTPNRRNLLKDGVSLVSCKEGDLIPLPPPPHNCKTCVCLDNHIYCSPKGCLSMPEIKHKEQNVQNDLEIIEKQNIVEPVISFLHKNDDKTPTQLIHTHAYSGFHQEIKVHSNQLPKDATKLISVLTNTRDNSAHASDNEKNPEVSTAPVPNSTDLKKKSNENFTPNRISDGDMAKNSPDQPEIQFNSTEPRLAINSGSNQEPQLPTPIDQFKVIHKPGKMVHLLEKLLNSTKATVPLNSEPNNFKQGEMTIQSYPEHKLNMSALFGNVYNSKEIKTIIGPKEQQFSAISNNRSDTNIIPKQNLLELFKVKPSFHSPNLNSSQHQPLQIIPNEMALSYDEYNRGNQTLSLLPENSNSLSINPLYISYPGSEGSNLLSPPSKIEPNYTIHHFNILTPPRNLFKSDFSHHEPSLSPPEIEIVPNQESVYIQPQNSQYQNTERYVLPQSVVKPVHEKIMPIVPIKGNKNPYTDQPRYKINPLITNDSDNILAYGVNRPQAGNTSDNLFYNPAYSMADKVQPVQSLNELSLKIPGNYLSFPNNSMSTYLNFSEQTAPQISFIPGQAHNKYSQPGLWNISDQNSIYSYSNISYPTYSYPSISNPNTFYSNVPSPNISYINNYHQPDSFRNTTYLGQHGDSQFDISQLPSYPQSNGLQMYPGGYKYNHPGPSNISQFENHKANLPQAADISDHLIHDQEHFMADKIQPVQGLNDLSLQTPQGNYLSFLNNSMNTYFNFTTPPPQISFIPGQVNNKIYNQPGFWNISVQNPIFSYPNIKYPTYSNVPNPNISYINNYNQSGISSPNITNPSYFHSDVPNPSLKILQGNYLSFPNNSMDTYLDFSKQTPSQISFIPGQGPNKYNQPGFWNISDQSPIYSFPNVSPTYSYPSISNPNITNPLYFHSDLSNPSLKIPQGNYPLFPNNSMDTYLDFSKQTPSQISFKPGQVDNKYSQPGFWNISDQSPIYSFPNVSPTYSYPSISNPNITNPLYFHSDLSNPSLKIPQGNYPLFPNNSMDTYLDFSKQPPPQISFKPGQVDNKYSQPGFWNISDQSPIYSFPNVSPTYSYPSISNPNITNPLYFHSDLSNPSLKILQGNYLSFPNNSMDTYLDFSKQTPSQISFIPGQVDNKYSQPGYWNISDQNPIYSFPNVSYSTYSYPSISNPNIANPKYFYSNASNPSLQKTHNSMGTYLNISQQIPPQISSIPGQTDNKYSLPGLWNVSDQNPIYYYPNISYSNISYPTYSFQNNYNQPVPWNISQTGHYPSYTGSQFDTSQISDQYSNKYQYYHSNESDVNQFYPTQSQYSLPIPAGQFPKVHMPKDMYNYYYPNISEINHFPQPGPWNISNSQFNIPQSPHQFLYPYPSVSHGVNFNKSSILNMTDYPPYYLQGQVAPAYMHDMYYYPNISETGNYPFYSSDSQFGIPQMSNQGSLQYIYYNPKTSNAKSQFGIPQISNQALHYIYYRPNISVPIGQFNTSLIPNQGPLQYMYYFPNVTGGITQFGTPQITNEGGMKYMYYLPNVTNGNSQFGTPTKIINGEGKKYIYYHPNIFDANSRIGTPQDSDKGGIKYIYYLPNISDANSQFGIPQGTEEDGIKYIYYLPNISDANTQFGIPQVTEQDGIKYIYYLPNISDANSQFGIPQGTEEDGIKYIYYLPNISDANSQFGIPQVTEQDGIKYIYYLPNISDANSQFGIPQVTEQDGIKYIYYLPNISDANSQFDIPQISNQSSLKYIYYHPNISDANSQFYTPQVPNDQEKDGVIIHTKISEESTDDHVISQNQQNLTRPQPDYSVANQSKPALNDSLFPDSAAQTSNNNSNNINDSLESRFGVDQDQPKFDNLLSNSSNLEALNNTISTDGDPTNYLNDSLQSRFGESQNQLSDILEPATGINSSIMVENINNITNSNKSQVETPNLKGRFNEQENAIQSFTWVYQPSSKFPSQVIHSIKDFGPTSYYPDKNMPNYVQNYSNTLLNSVVHPHLEIQAPDSMTHAGDNEIIGSILQQGPPTQTLPWVIEDREIPIHLTHTSNSEGGFNEEQLQHPTLWVDMPPTEPPNQIPTLSKNLGPAPYYPHNNFKGKFNELEHLEHPLMLSDVPPNGAPHQTMQMTNNLGPAPYSPQTNIKGTFNVLDHSKHPVMILDAPPNGPPHQKVPWAANLELASYYAQNNLKGTDNELEHSKHPIMSLDATPSRPPHQSMQMINNLELASYYTQNNLKGTDNELEHSKHPIMSLDATPSRPPHQSMQMTNNLGPATYYPQNNSKGTFSELQYSKHPVIPHQTVPWAANLEFASSYTQNNMKGTVNELEHSKHPIMSLDASPNRPPHQTMQMTNNLGPAPYYPQNNLKGIFSELGPSKHPTMFLNAPLNGPPHQTVSMTKDLGPASYYAQNTLKVNEQEHSLHPIMWLNAPLNGPPQQTMPWAANFDLASYYTQNNLKGTANELEHSKHPIMSLEATPNRPPHQIMPMINNLGPAPYYLQNNMLNYIKNYRSTLPQSHLAMFSHLANQVSKQSLPWVMDDRENPYHFAYTPFLKGRFNDLGQLKYNTLPQYGMVHPKDYQKIPWVIEDREPAHDITNPRNAFAHAFTYGFNPAQTIDGTINQLPHFNDPYMAGVVPGGGFPNQQFAWTLAQEPEPDRFPKFVIPLSPQLPQQEIHYPSQVPGNYEIRGNADGYQIQVPQTDNNSRQPRVQINYYQYNRPITEPQKPGYSNVLDINTNIEIPNTCSRFMYKDQNEPSTANIVKYNTPTIRTDSESDADWEDFTVKKLEAANKKAVTAWVKNSVKNVYPLSQNETVFKNHNVISRIANLFNKLVTHKLKADDLASHGSVGSGTIYNITYDLDNVPHDDTVKSESRFNAIQDVKKRNSKYPEFHIVLHQDEDTLLLNDRESQNQPFIDEIPEHQVISSFPKYLDPWFKHRPKDHKEECGEGSEWMTNCHGCRCRFGQAVCFEIPDCNLRPFGEPMTCKPYSHFKMGDCYTCECNGDGVAECDATECSTESSVKVVADNEMTEFKEFYDEKKTSELIKHYSFFNKLPKDCSSNKQYPTCQIGSTWVSSCYKCKCKPNGRHECTWIKECKLDYDSYGKPARCKPNSKFYPKTTSLPCGECSCDDEGNPHCLTNGNKLQ